VVSLLSPRYHEQTYQYITSQGEFGHFFFGAPRGRRSGAGRITPRKGGESFLEERMLALNKDAEFSNHPAGQEKRFDQPSQTGFGKLWMRMMFAKVPFI
jgi:hypothetical protein